jgi:O-antigen ligase
VFGVILIYLATAVGVVGSAFQPLIGLFVYVGFAMLRPQYLWSFAGDLGGLSQWVGVATLAGWALRGCGRLNVGPARGVATLLILFTGWTTLSAAMGIDSPRSNNWVIELLKVVGPFMVGVTLLNTRKLITAMLWTIVAAHGYIAWEMNSWYYLRGYNYVRESGYGYMDNNSFGLSLVTVIGLAGALALASRKWPAKIIAAVCAVLILSTIILTYSRGSLLGLGIAGAVAIVLIPKRPSYVAVILIGTLALARLAGPGVRDRFETVFAEEDERDDSAQSRVDLWAACLDVGLKNPLTGIGPRNFPLVAVNYGFAPGKEAHSTWMQAVAEMGFPGAGLLMLFYLTIIKKLMPVAWRKWTPELREESAIAAGVLISLSAFFVSAQFVTMVGLETPYYVTMVAVAMLKVRQQAMAAEQPALTLVNPTSYRPVPFGQPSVSRP